MTWILCAKRCLNDAKMYTENHEWFKIIQLGIFMDSWLYCNKEMVWEDYRFQKSIQTQRKYTR
jgi:hypothetical protein